MLKFRKYDIQWSIIVMLFFFAQIASSVVQIFLMTILLVGVILTIVEYRKSVWVFIFLALVMQKALQRISANSMLQFVTYLDEILELVLLFYILNSLVKGRVYLSRLEKKIFVNFGIYILIALISSIVNMYSTVFVVVLDMFVCSKFIIFYLSGIQLSRSGLINDRDMFDWLNGPAIHITVVLFILSIHEIFLNAYFEKYDYRYFMESLQLFFLHPTYLAAVCITIITILIYNTRYKKNNLFYILLISTVAFATFRSKAIAAVFIIFVIYFVYVKYKVPIKNLLVVAAGCIVIIGGVSNLCCIS